MSGESQTVRAQWSARVQQAKEELEDLLAERGLELMADALPPEELKAQLLQKKHQLNMMQSNYLKPQLARVQSELKQVHDEIGKAPRDGGRDAIQNFQRLINEIKTQIDADNDGRGFTGTKEQLKSYVKDLKVLYKKMDQEVAFKQLEGRRLQLKETNRALQRLISGFKTDEQVEQANRLSVEERTLSGIVHTMGVVKRDMKAQWHMAFKSLKSVNIRNAIKFAGRAVMLFFQHRKLNQRMTSIVPNVTSLRRQLGIQPGGTMIQFGDGNKPMLPDEVQKMMDRGLKLRPVYHYHGEGDITFEFEAESRFGTKLR